MKKRKALLKSCCILLLLTFIYSCSKTSDEEEIVDSNYLLTEYITYRGYTDEIILGNEIIYDQDDKLIMTNLFSTTNPVMYEKLFFEYDESSDLAMIRFVGDDVKEANLIVSKEKGIVSLTGWEAEDDLSEIKFYFNDENLITKKEIFYSSFKEVYTFKHNLNGQLLEIRAETENPYVIKFSNYLNANSTDYFGWLWTIDAPISIALNLKFNKKGVPSTYSMNGEQVDVDNIIDENNNLLDVFNGTNKLSFKHKEKLKY